ncbi:type II toxin-antitoxin system VapC family toxin [uncultured Amnibacterium sp.]|uniref:type II toxin-antitoxin system VapC family toxin n=1 Tax=uncultured Amnibacterium sp. TaxID=1631851 RepID=UPI0035CC47BC
MSHVVADASVLVPLTVDDGERGAQAAAALRGHRLLAPQIVRFETLQGVWNLERRSVISAAHAVRAVQLFSELRIELFPIDGLVDRVWQLRHNATVYDASYAAVAELARVPLITFDARLARVPGIRCEIVVPA